MTLSGTLLLGSCVSIPDSVQPVTDFQLNRYLGTWYEIARLDHSFERGLSNVSAEYSLNEDGSVKVINRGYSASDNDWNEAMGRAKFVNTETSGYLKVSFFGPFYGSYIIFELDKQNYQYAMIAGPDKSYLWILARQPQLDGYILQKLVYLAKQAGFDTDKLIFVEHNSSGQ